jgi:hypothetical protein
MSAEPPKPSVVRSFVDRIWTLIKIGYCRATNADPDVSSVFLYWRCMALSV